MNDNTSLFEKWNKWLDEIHNDIREILFVRYVFEEIRGIVGSNPKIQVPSLFYDWLLGVYAITGAVGVRRQADTDERAISFARLLSDIRKFFVKNSGREEFDKYFAQVDLSRIDIKELQQDLSELQKKSGMIKTYATKTVAHLDESKSDIKIPTYAQLDECLDYLEELLKKYLRLFRGTDYHNIVPIPQYNWKVIFRHPWIEDELAQLIDPPPDLPNDEIDEWLKDTDKKAREEAYKVIDELRSKNSQ